MTNAAIKPLTASSSLRLRKELPWLLLSLTIVTLVWCGHYDRWTRQAWSTPLLHSADERAETTFSGDAFWGIATAKAMATGETLPILPKSPKSLGAPFRANWNDWPTVEEGIVTAWAVLARCFGLFTSSNLILLSAHLLAAASFYLVCAYLGYSRILASAGAILFAMSRYAFWRGLPHLTLTFYWHIPLGFLVLWWCVRDRANPAENKAKLAASLFVAVLYGAQNPYYSGMFFVLLLGAAIAAWLRDGDKRRAILPLATCGVLIGTLALMNLDTLSYRLAHGPNPGAVLRSYADVELYALKPIEFLLPFSHRIDAIQVWAQRIYFSQTISQGEAGSAYLGVIGCVALGILLWSAGIAILRGQEREVPLHFWGVLAVILTCVIGGINSLLGLAGLSVFRATNRYSIVILAAVLLFAVKMLTKWTRGWGKPALTVLALLIAVVGLLDQIPPLDPRHEAVTRAAMASDRSVIKSIESQLPAGAMIFQLPVSDFPESPPAASMSEYEQFRPYLQSRQLRFSYGSDKGRYRERWQKEAEHLEPVGMASLLESYGFSAILLNRKGYFDGGTAFLEKIAVAGYSIVARSNEFACIALHPVAHPTLPPEFGAGWYSLEGSYADAWRWSSGNATLILHNPDQAETPVRLKFDLESPQRRLVTVAAGPRTRYEMAIDPGVPAAVTLPVALLPGENEVRFTTDLPGELPLVGETRNLAFRIVGFNAEAQ